MVVNNKEDDKGEQESLIELSKAKYHEPLQVDNLGIIANATRHKKVSYPRTISTRCTQATKNDR